MKKLSIIICCMILILYSINGLTLKYPIIDTFEKLEIKQKDETI